MFLFRLSILGLIYKSYSYLYEMLYEQEIGKLLCQMYLLKSPGPGGMPGLLFKSYWKVIGRLALKQTNFDCECKSFWSFYTNKPVLLAMI